MTIQHHGNGQNAPRLLGVSRPRRLRPQLRNTQILARNLDCRHVARSANHRRAASSHICGWLGIPQESNSQAVGISELVDRVARLVHFFDPLRNEFEPSEETFDLSARHRRDRRTSGLPNPLTHGRRSGPLAAFPSALTGATNAAYLPEYSTPRLTFITLVAPWPFSGLAGGSGPHGPHQPLPLRP